MTGEVELVEIENGAGILRIEFFRLEELLLGEVEVAAAWREIHIASHGEDQPVVRR